MATILKINIKLLLLNRKANSDMFGNQVRDTGPSWPSYLSYMDKTAILFNGPALFGQIINIHSKKTFTCYTNVYMCIARGKGDYAWGQKFDFN